MKEFKIKVEGQEWEKAIDDAFNRANAKVTIDGFRPGKAPKEVFLKKYGKESLYMDAADIAMNKEYVKVLENNKDLEIIAQPQVELGDINESGVEFTIKVAIKPIVTLGKYKGLKVTKSEPEVTEDEIEHEIHHLQHKYEEQIIKNGSAEMHDVVTIDFEGFKDGVAFEGGKAENHDLQLGSNSFIPGFEEQLVGMNKGDTKDINVTFPENYHAEDLKGKEVTFKVTVKEVKESVHPELNEQFFEDLGMEGVNDEASLKAMIKENIKVGKERELENKYIDDLLEAAAKNVTVEIPSVMIDNEIHNMIHQYEDNLKMQGLTLELFYQYANMTEETLKEQMKEEANKRVLYRLMLEQIAKEENFEITDEEADKEATSIAAKYQMEKDKFLEMFGGLDMVKFDMKMRKAIEILKN
jgi:trigger factor